MTHTVRQLGLLLLALLVGTAAAADPPTVAKMTNADAVRKQLGLFAHYPGAPLIGDMKVAVLDSGFDRFDGKRPYLPKSAVLVEHYDPEFVKRNNLGDPAYQKPLIPGDPHGRLMAQMVWAMTGYSPHGPQFYLLNANGPTLFRRAVRYAIEQKVDVILFSGTFEGAGNYDGRGPLAATVDEALAAGVIWVNAAGNSGGMVYDSPVSVNADGYLKLRLGSDPTSLRLVNRFDENSVTVTLTWNDYRDEEDAGTDKDLDLIVEDWKGRVVGESKLKQIPAGQDAGVNETKNPRERLVLTDLPAASAPNREYRIRVKANSGTFSTKDRVRILVTAARSVPFTDPDSGKTVRPVELLDATRSREVYPPADHAGVLTIGDTASASAVGPTADGRLKPDVVLGESLARFSNGEESVGSSNAAAFFAGAVTVMKATEPKLTTAHLREWVRRLDARTTLVTEKTTQSQFRVIEPLTPNQERALRTATLAAEERKRRGEVDPKVYVSNSTGQYVVTPASGGATTRAAPPEPSRSQLHSPWQAPTPRVLAELVRK